MGMGRGPQFEKDSEDLIEALSGHGVRVGLFVLVLLVGGSILVGTLW